MFITGIVSILQMVLLPGFLALRLLRLRPGGAAELLAAIPLSLTLNHFLVIGLVLAGAYSPGAMYAVLAVEVIAIALCLRAEARQGEGAPVPSEWGRLSSLVERIRSGGPAGAIAWWTLLWLAGAVFFLHVRAAVQSVGTVFDHWDAVVSWNRWATEWAGNAFPTITWRYPQLLPTNVSLGYVLLRSTSVQLFAKGAMIVFPIAQLLMLADAAVRRKNAGYLAALVLVGTTNLLTLAGFLMAGYADLPVAYMITASLYFLVLAEDASERRERTLWLAVACVAAAGAALTKQGGLLWALVAPVLAAAQWRRGEVETGADGERSRLRATVLVLGVFLAISLALVVPWYAYKSYQIGVGREQTEAVGVAQANAGRTYAESARHVHAMLRDAVSQRAVDLLLPLVVLGAFLSSRWGWAAILFGIPYLAICVGMTSYDLRNFAPGWPVVLTSGAVGWAEVLGRWRARAPPRRVRWRPAAAIGGVLAVGLAMVVFRAPTSSRWLRELQAQNERNIGSPALNEALYACDEGQRLEGNIITDYQPLGYLPRLRDRYVRDHFQDLETFRRLAARPENRFVLLRRESVVRSEAAMIEHVDRELAAGRYRLVLETAGYRLVEIVRREGP